MINNYAICIPNHKSILTKNEIKNIKISLKNNNYKNFYFILPKKINKYFYKKQFPKIKIFCFDDFNFKDENSYNRFLLKPDLYLKFSKFKFLVICQTDAILLRDISKINFFNYDYLGAPWKPPIKINILDIYGIGFINNFLNLKKKKLFVGNGGLSIRKTLKFLDITKKINFISFVNCGEDVFFSYMAEKYKIKIPNYNFSNKIFRENTSSKEKISKENFIFGYHALEKWNPYLNKKIYKKYDF